MVIINFLVYFTCEDIFILYDMWMQAQHEPHLKNATILQKLDWAYRHSFWAMFGIISLLSNNFFIVTSLTSAIAFASNGFSQIIPIKLFGIFMVYIMNRRFYLIGYDCHSKFLFNLYLVYSFDRNLEFTFC